MNHRAAHIREAETQDVEAILRLYRQLVRPVAPDVAVDVRADRIEQIRSDLHNFLWILESDEGVVGTAFVTLLIRFSRRLLRMSGSSSLPFTRPAHGLWKIWGPRLTNLGRRHLPGVDGVVPLCQSLHLFSHRTTNASLHPFSPRYSSSRWLPASSSPSARRTTTTSAPHWAATSHDPVSRAHLFPDHVVSRAQYFNRPL